jgi:hypothetical protein
MSIITQGYIDGLVITEGYGAGVIPPTPPTPPTPPANVSSGGSGGGGHPLAYTPWIRPNRGEKEAARKQKKRETAIGVALMMLRG